MIDHVSIGVDDLAAARRFYDAAFAPLGFRCLKEGGDGLGYGADVPFFWVSEVANPVAPDLQSGLHFCFRAPSRESVDAFHAAGLGAGGRDNGAPRLRPEYDASYYAAFVIDPAGYRLEAYCGTP